MNSPAITLQLVLDFNSVFETIAAIDNDEGILDQHLVTDLVASHEAIYGYVHWTTIAGQITPYAAEIGKPYALTLSVDANATLVKNTLGEGNGDSVAGITVGAVAAAFLEQVEAPIAWIRPNAS